MISQNSHKQKDKHILDNRLNTVVNYLRAHLPAAEIFRLVSAYFTIYGYEALQSELHRCKGRALSLWRSGIGWRSRSQRENGKIF